MTRPEQELDILEKISLILGEGLELNDVFQHAMNVLVDQMGIKRASLTLWDDATEQLRIIAAVGFSQKEIAKGRYGLGEGITGQVMKSGEPRVIADISQDNDFLNRTGRQDLIDTDDKRPISYICVPVKGQDRYTGTIAIDKTYTDEMSLAADARLLTIIAGSFSQTIRVHQLIKIETEQLLEQNASLRDNLGKRYNFDNIVGSSPAMEEVLATVSQVASSRATALLLGETGVGKEMIAKAIHYNSPRKDKPLIRINCGALSPQLLESELFGHVKGAFTGAIKDKIGRFEAADGGSIFLDEIGTMDSQLQVKLLRVLQEREFERVGDHHSVKIDVRVIAATNLDLEEAVQAGDFREDLYYRLNVVTINIPPLRNRREDIPRLIDFFLDQFNKENARDLRRINRDILNTLLRYPWPGNVRELENCIERAVVLSTSDEFTEASLPLQIRMFAQQVRGSSSSESLETTAGRLAAQAIREHEMNEGQIYEIVVNQIERALITEALEHTGGVKTRAADFLGINRNTLNKKVKDLNIEADG